MKKSVIIILGLALMQFGCSDNEGTPAGSGGDGGSGGTAGTGGAGGTGGTGGGEGGTGGAPPPCFLPADCNDDDPCTVDVCDPLTNECSNPPATDGTQCDDNGGPGLCSEGICAPACDVKDCSDGNDCTQDICNPVDGTCSNPNETNDTDCMVGNDPGLCQSGMCQGLCFDAETRCDDSNDCTDNDCEPADGTCINTALTGSACELDGVAGVCNAGVCEASGLCNDAATRCDDGNECTNNLCNPADGVCSNPNVADDTSCADGGGSCQSGTCELDPVQAEEFLALDCALLGNSASIPIDSEVTPGGVAAEGVPLDVVPQETIVLPASLVCGFLVAGFLDAEIANSSMAITMANASPGSAALTDFLDDGSASPALVSPHTNTLFSFATACGCNNPTPGDLIPPCGTGPGIIVPFLANGPGTIPPGTDPVTITPGSGSTVDFLVTDPGIALELRNLRTGAFTIPEICLGGACTGSACAAENRDTIPGDDSADDSPRIMYDATCNKTQAAAGDCIPFDSFAGIADVCVGRPPNSPVDPADCTDSATCCAALETLYPTATPAQQPQLSVTPAP